MSASRPPQQPPESPVLRINHAHVRWLIVVLVVAMIVVAFVFRGEFKDIEDTVRRLGYPIVFAAALLGSAGMVIPLPSTAAIFFGGAVLNPAYVGLLAGVAEGLGEITGYALGYSSQGVLERSRFYQRVHGWVDRWGWIPVVIFAIIPNPVFDVLGIAAGALRLSLPKFLAAAIVGKTIKNLGIAYAGDLGAEWVADWLGV